MRNNRVGYESSKRVEDLNPPPMSDACANPDCGHPKNHHSAGRYFCIENLACSCLAFVADVNRPVRDYGMSAFPAAAVPDREGATEQLADLLAAHDATGYDDFDGCICGDDTIGGTWDQYRAHVAAVIVAAGWEKR
jgi:hypothetical protein